MRFQTEISGLNYIKGKEIRDARNPKAKTKAVTDVQCKEQYDYWLERKTFMFYPEEQIALRGKDHRNRKGKINQAVRNHHVNTFVDWAEERPRRRALIIVNANQKQAATQIAKAVDIMGGDHTFDGLGLSSNGKEPASDLWCSWNCSASEYDFFEKQAMPWWRLFDGAPYDTSEKIDEFLATLNLKRIQPKPFNSKKEASR